MNKIKQKMIARLEECKKAILKDNYNQATLVALDIAILTKNYPVHKKLKNGINRILIMPKS